MNRVHKQCPKIDSRTVLSQTGSKQAECTECTACWPSTTPRPHAPAAPRTCVPRAPLACCRACPTRAAARTCACYRVGLLPRAPEHLARPPAPAAALSAPLRLVRARAAQHPTPARPATCVPVARLARPAQRSVVGAVAVLQYSPTYLPHLVTIHLLYCGTVLALFSTIQTPPFQPLCHNTLQCIAIHSASQASQPAIQTSVLQYTSSPSKLPRLQYNFYYYNTKPVTIIQFRQ